MSLSTLVFIVGASRSDPTGRDFGAVVLLFSAYQLVFGCFRTIVGEALAVVGPTAESQKGTGEGPELQAIAFAIRVGLVGVGGWLVAASLVPDGFGKLTVVCGLALAVAIPGDAARFAALLEGRTRVAALADLAIEGSFLLSVLFLETLGASTPGRLLGSFLLSRLVGGLAYRRVLAASARSGVASSSWLKTAWPESPVYLLEYVVGRGLGEAVTWIIAVTSMASTAGGYRLAQAVFGPAVVVAGGCRLMLLPQARRRAIERPSSALAFGALLTGSMVAVILLVGSAAIALPEDMVTQVVGPGWRYAVPFVIPIALLRSIQGIGAGGRLATRCLRLTKRAALARIVTGLVTLAGVWTGARLGDEAAIVYGLAAGAAVGAGAWWYLSISHVRAVR